jgi:thioredoxin 1
MKESFKDIINSDTPVLVDFSAEWCGPCKTLAPILKEVAGGIEGKARIIKIDIDRNPETASHYQVQAVPTLILFKRGQAVWRSSGVMPAHQLKQVISQFTT